MPNYNIDVLGGLNITKLYGEGLDKLEAIETEKKEKARLQSLYKKASEIYQGGDSDEIAEFALQNPEISDALTKAASFHNEKTKENYINSIFYALQNPTKIPEVIAKRQELLKSQGVSPDQTQETDSFLEKYNKNPEGVLKSLEQEVAWMAPKKYKAYKEAMGSTIEKTANIKDFEYYEKLKKIDPDLAKTFSEGAGFVKDEKDETTAAAKNFNTYMDFLAKDPKKAKLFGDSIGINRVTPYTDLAKLKTDFDNKFVSETDYNNKKDDILNPTMKNKTELTMAALHGDEEAKNVLKALTEDSIKIAGLSSEAATKGKLKALHAVMDIDGVANAILEGRETIDNVRNTFGVPIQEAVREKVLKIEPDFNFVQPRAIQKSLSASLLQQQKNRGAMGNFVLNINGQLKKVNDIMTDVIKRVGARAIDLPFRELHTRFKGSGNERLLEAYMKEISVEIFKLSQGSTASVALLPEEGRKEWEKIHDVNLSYPQLKIILAGTRDMANIRLKSVNDEIKFTVEKLGNIRELENKYLGEPGEPGAEFEDLGNTIKVINPETGEEETWDTKTEKRIK